MSAADYWMALEELEGEAARALSRRGDVADPLAFLEREFGLRGADAERLVERTKRARRKLAVEPAAAPEATPGNVSALEYEFDS